MRIVGYFGWTVGLLALVIQSAFADDANPLIGKWAEHTTFGSMITEFTPSTMAFTPVDQSGKPTKAPNLAHVGSYTIHGNTIIINFQEKGGGGLMATLTDDPNSVLLIFPGMPGAHKLTRIQPQ